MAKAPVAGQVKTRLVPQISPTEAADLSRALLVDQLQHLSGSPGVDLYLAFSPHEARTVMEQLAPAVFQLFPQEGDDLGARMGGVFERLFATGYKRIILIGGDLGPIPFDFLEQAYAFLESERGRVVLGPARDGGYYLVGANQSVPQMFEEMSWSHSRVLAQTRAKLAALEIEHHLLPVWFDVDTLEDLRYLESALEPVKEKAANTLKLLQRLKLSGE